MINLWMIFIIFYPEFRFGSTADSPECPAISNCYAFPRFPTVFRESLDFCLQLSLFGRFYPFISPEKCLYLSFHFLVALPHLSSKILEKVKTLLYFIPILLSRGFSRSGNLILWSILILGPKPYGFKTRHDTEKFHFAIALNSIKIEDEWSIFAPGLF